MVPVLAVGFGDLKKRIESQESQTQLHSQKLTEMVAEADALDRKHHLVTLLKLKEYKRRQAAITHKVLQVRFLL